MTYRQDKSKHYVGMTTKELADFAELVFLLKHTPPPIGFNRKPFTTPQQRVIDDLYDLISFPADYNEITNKKTGQ